MSEQLPLFSYNVWIKGPRGGHVYREDYIYRYVDEAVDILNLDKGQEFDIHVTVYKKFPEEYNSAYGMCYGDDVEVEIDLSREDITFDFMMQTLSHEMIHAKQAIENRTMYEAEANKGELFLHNRIQERLGGRVVM